MEKANSGTLSDLGRNRAYSEDDGFGGYAKGFAGLHQHMEKLQKAMAARLDELEERLCNEQPPLITVMDSQRYRGGDVPMEGEDPPDDWEKSRRSVKQAYRNQLDGRASVVSSRRGRTSVVSSSRLSTDSILEDYFRRGSLVWEATKAQRKVASRQSRIIMERRMTQDQESGPMALVRQWAGRIVNSAVVTQGVMLLVFVHVVLLGIEVNLSATTLNDIPPWFSLVNLIIVGFFIIELLLKFVHLGCVGFWCGVDNGWNFFDFVIVALSAADCVLDYWSKSMSDTGVVQDLRVLRSVRFVRAVRSIRIIRIFRYMAALRTLVLSIVSTMASLMWTLALLAVIIYAFGIVLTSMTAEHCRSRAEEGGQCSGDMRYYWSSVPASMLTLFMIISQGVDWGNAMEPLTQVSGFAVFLVLLFVIVTIFAILNVVTGVFCQTAIESASNDKDVATMRQVSSKSQKVAQLKAIFQEMDRENVNYVSFMDVREAANSPELKDFLESMGISTDDIWTWFVLLDTDETGLVDLDAFVSGCMQLYGNAKSMQMAKMSYENKLLRQAMTAMADKLDKEFEELKRYLRSSVSNVRWQSQVKEQF